MKEQYPILYSINQIHGIAEIYPANNEQLSDIIDALTIHLPLKTPYEHQHKGSLDSQNIDGNLLDKASEHITKQIHYEDLKDEELQRLKLNTIELSDTKITLSTKKITIQAKNFPNNTTAFQAIHIPRLYDTIQELDKHYGQFQKEHPFAQTTKRYQSPQQLPQKGFYEITTPYLRERKTSLELQPLQLAMEQSGMYNYKRTSKEQEFEETIQTLLNN